MQAAGPYYDRLIGASTSYIFSSSSFPSPSPLLFLAVEKGEDVDEISDGIVIAGGIVTDLHARQSIYISSRIQLSSLLFFAGYMDNCERKPQLQ